MSQARFLYEPLHISLHGPKGIVVDQVLFEQVRDIVDTPKYQNRFLPAGTKAMAEKAFKKWLGARRSVLRELRVEVETTLKIGVGAGFLRVKYYQGLDTTSRTLAEVTELKVTLYPF